MVLYFLHAVTSHNEFTLWYAFHQSFAFFLSCIFYVNKNSTGESKRKGNLKHDFNIAQDWKKY
jgi:uncharacterized membrane protein